MRNQSRRGGIDVRFFGIGAFGHAIDAVAARACTGAAKLVPINEGEKSDRSSVCKAGLAVAALVDGSKELVSWLFALYRFLRSYLNILASGTGRPRIICSFPGDSCRICSISSALTFLSIFHFLIIPLYCFLLLE